jgi:magnesium transporter
MKKLVMERSRKAGLPPGTLVHIGDRKRETTDVTLYRYDENHFEEKKLMRAGMEASLLQSSHIRWINIDGVHDVEMLEAVGKCMGLHPLVMEDISNTDQRPKVEDYGDYVYIVAKMLYLVNEDREVIFEQVSLILGKDFVITFQEKEADVFEPVRSRIRSGIGRVRKMEADYLAYCILDAIVDSYFLVLEKLGDRVEEVEDRLVTHPSREDLHRITRLKREMLFLHKAVWPLREVTGTLARGEYPMFCDSTVVYMRDVYDHIIHIIDTIDTFRDIISGMLDIYLSSISNRMNEIMKVLTIISTIFIPLTFIVGIYGMNFRYIPEFGWKWGYPSVMAVMLALAAFMLYWFKRKKWL